MHVLNLEEQCPPTRMLLPVLILDCERGACHSAVGMLKIHLRTTDFSKWGLGGGRCQEVGAESIVPPLLLALTAALACC